MKDLYKALGLTSQASLQEIKKAYRSLALNAHPDRGGDEERMGLLNEAYEKLSDPENRRKFDRDWQAYQETEDNTTKGAEAENYLLAGNSVPYSAILREEHRALVTQYRMNPLPQTSVQADLLPFSSNIYTEVNAAGQITHYHDIFSFIRAKEQLKTNNSSPIPTQTLSPLLAINLFTDFLSGQFYGKNLIQLDNYLALAIPRAIYSYGAHERLLYDAIAEIVAIATNATIREHAALITSLQKLTEFAKKTPSPSLEALTALFYNEHFRVLYAYALHCYWQEKVTRTQETAINDKILKQLDGYQKAMELLHTLKEKLSNGNENANLGKLVQTVRLLLYFEKDAHNANSQQKTAKSLREAAFHFLDWLSFFLEYTGKKVIINVLFQIGLKFQEASRFETNPAIQMADQRLAFKMYLEAIEIGKKATPDIEIYALAHGLKQMMSFKFQDDLLKSCIPMIQKRVLVIADFFPFSEAHHSNISFFWQENAMVLLMRHLLNTMVNILERNKASATPTVLPHSASTILYYAYEACLKNWYQPKHDADVEKKIRLDLMESLLSDKGWTFSEMESNLNAPWIMVDRDENGWMRPTRSLPYANANNLTLYRSINGAEINHMTGEITFYLTPWDPDRPAYEKVFSLFDLQEILEKNIIGGLFSLDPVDPDKMYHPFNKMLLLPTQLYESEFLNTMLLTDYVLKLLTTNQEVQAQYPYEQQSLSQMILHLPKYLRNIIDRFHKTQKSEGSTHRFWIEAEAVDLKYSEYEQKNSKGYFSSHLTKLELGQLKMVVKKHLMVRDINGELKDSNDDDEGWPIYVLTEQQFEELQKNHHKEYHRVTMVLGDELKQANIDKDTIFLQQNNNTLTAYWFDYYGNINQKTLPLDEVEEIFEYMHAPLVSSNDRNAIKKVLSEFGFFCGKIDEKAMIFIEDRIRLFYWENNQILQKHIPEDAPGDYFETILCSLYEEPREANGKIIPTSSNMPLLVRAMQVMSRQSGQPHHLSAEFLFAHEFTTHYDEFAHYLPEFGRLKELSRIIALTEYLDRIRRNNQKNIDAIDAVLNKSNKANNNDILYKSIQEDFNKIKIEILNAFSSPHMSEYTLASKCPSSSLEEIRRALHRNNIQDRERIATKEAASQLEKRKENQIKIESGFAGIGFAKETPPDPKELEDVCFWVPASVRHEVKEVYTGGGARHSFFVYGGVHVEPKINVKQGSATPLSGTPIRASDLQATSGGGKLPPNSGGRNTTGGTSGGGNGHGGSSGGGNGGRGDGGGKPKRFEILASEVTREQVRTMLKNGSINVNATQANEIKKLLGSGQMNSVSIKKMHNGNIHFSYERPGHTSGFQRMSFKIAENGVKLRVVQTAFDDNNNLVHQRPGASKNNLYDVKK